MLTEFELDAVTCKSWGLAPLRMSRLGNIVVLAGKNGAGKSRVLKAVDWRTSIMPPRAIDILPRESYLHDHYNTRETADTHAHAAANALGSHTVATASISYAERLGMDDWNLSHQDSEGSESEKQEARDAFSSFRQLVRDLLGQSLERDPKSSRLKIFGSLIKDAQLSQGQILLFQAAVILHAQQSRFANNVLLMDEPENHLHPEATIDFVDRLSNGAPNAQFWIATHSVPLIASLHARDPYCLWFVEDGQVTQAGRAPERVLASLLGQDERIENLRTFMLLPSQLAQVNFARQCLMPPGVAATGSGDPQILQITAVLQQLSTNLKVDKLRILDIGPGRGRLLDGFIEAKASVDYLAYEPFPHEPYKRECQDRLTRLYETDPSSRYFEKPDELFNHVDKNSVHVALLSNVLHEVRIDDWGSLFGAHGLCRTALHADGYLLIVEDQQIPVGENAHKHGFLVLDQRHLRELFDVKEADAELLVTSECHTNPRLKAHLVHASLLQRFTHETKRAAIRALLDTAREEITRCRQGESSTRNGLALAFWTQQFANASLAFDAC